MNLGCLFRNSGEGLGGGFFLFKLDDYLCFLRNSIIDCPVALRKKRQR